MIILLLWKCCIKRELIVIVGLSKPVFPYACKLMVLLSQNCFQDNVKFMVIYKQLTYTREIRCKLNQTIPLSSLLATLDQVKLWWKLEVWFQALIWTCLMLHKPLSVFYLCLLDLEILQQFSVSHCCSRAATSAAVLLVFALPVA